MELQRILLLNRKKTVLTSIRANSGHLNITAQAHTPLNRASKVEIKRQLESCLRLGEDFTEFHSESRRHSQYRWVAAVGAGRLLRAPTLFEDMVKMICTTNCTWALTTLMTTNLVEALGVQFGSSLRAFPAPAAIAGCTEQFMRSTIKSGYRSPYLIQFSEHVASGKLPVESWRISNAPTPELLRQVQSIKGVGPYAAANVLKLIGRYDYLGLDSWVRAKYYELHHRGRRVKDSTIENRYAKYGRWRGLFFWLEMTRHWHAGKFPS